MFRQYTKLCGGVFPELARLAYRNIDVLEDIQHPGDVGQSLSLVGERGVEVVEAAETRVRRADAR